MRAILIEKTGGPEVLRLSEVDEPSAADGMVKIKVHAVGVNRVETYFRQGMFGDIGEPRIPGVEAAGEVVEDKSGHFDKGQRVVTAMGGLMLGRDGSYAEYLLAPPGNVVAIDADLGWAELASLPEAYLTVWGALDKTVGIQPKQTLLVRGASSSVGLAAITYAKARGLTVIATTRSCDNKARLLEYGADHVIIDDGLINVQIKALFSKGVDKAIDMVGASSVKDTLLCLRYWGEAVVIGLLGGKTSLEPFDLLRDLPNTVKLSYFGSGLLGNEELLLSDSPLNWVAQQVSTGKIPCIIGRQFAIEEVQQAHELMESNKANGKLVMTL